MSPPRSHHEGGLHAASAHVRKYLLPYTLLSAAAAIPAGYYSSAFTAANKNLFSDLVVFFAILTIYPSMIQLRTEGLARSFRSWRPMAVSLVYVFVVSPLVAFGLAPSLGNSQIGIGFVTANIVPASSASLGYVLIAGGSIELATALAVLSFVIAIPAIPIFLGLYSSQVSAVVPIAPVLTSVLYILVLPFVAGQLTRYPLLKRKGPPFVNNTIRPYLSLATMLSMLALIFVLVDKESPVMVARPQTVGYVIGYQAAIIVGVLIVSVFVSRAMHLSYEDHQAVAFLSVSKNQSVAAAIATLALNPVSALAPSIIPMIQPVLAIVYINLEKPVRALLAGPGQPGLPATPLEGREVVHPAVRDLVSGGASESRSANPDESGRRPAAAACRPGAAREGQAISGGHSGSGPPPARAPAPAPREASSKGDSSGPIPAGSGSKPGEAVAPPRSPTPVKRRTPWT